MPIDHAGLETRFVVADTTITLAELRQKLGQAGGDVRYVVLRYPDGRFRVPSLFDLSQATAALGPAALDRPLGELPAAADPATAVDQTLVSLQTAKQERDRLPNRRLVVVRGGQPVGLLTNERRGGSFSGAPLDLYGWLVGSMSREELQQRFDSRVDLTTCPRCTATFKFYEVRADVGAYACPSCHAILNPSG